MTDVFIEGKSYVAFLDERKPDNIKRYLVGTKAMVVPAKNEIYIAVPGLKRMPEDPTLIKVPILFTNVHKHKMRLAIVASGAEKTTTIICTDLKWGKVLPAGDGWMVLLYGKIEAPTVTLKT